MTASGRQENCRGSWAIPKARSAGWYRNALKGCHRVSWLWPDPDGSRRLLANGQGSVATALPSGASVAPGKSGSDRPVRPLSIAFFERLAALALYQIVPNPQKNPLFSKDVGAVEKTRTSTGFRPQRPQRCASTNSATTAKSPGPGLVSGGRSAPLAKASGGCKRCLRGIVGKVSTAAAPHGPQKTVSPVSSRSRRLWRSAERPSWLRSRLRFPPARAGVWGARSLTCRRSARAYRAAR